MSELRKRGKVSVLDAFRGYFGVWPNAEIAEKAGCQVSNVVMYARRHGLNTGSGARVGSSSGRARKARKGGKGRVSRVEPYKALLGWLPDADIARLAECTGAAVSAYRKKAGISAATADSQNSFWAHIKALDGVGQQAAA